MVLHVGYALTKIDPEEAERTLELLREAGIGGMKYVDEYRDGALAQTIAATIAREARAGPRLSPDGVLRRPYPCDLALRPRRPAAGRVQLIHGPGCPVCVLPMAASTSASPARAARRHDVRLWRHDARARLRRVELPEGQGRGRRLRMVYSTLDAVRIAEAEPQREVVFFAIGFETTTPPTALAHPRRREEGADEFLRLLQPRADPGGDAAILETGERTSAVTLDGFIGPGACQHRDRHRALIEIFAGKYGKPVVIAGFEPLDVMQAILMLVRQINDGRAEVENQYIRAVTREGNARAQSQVAEMFELRESFEWRGLGVPAASALKLREPMRALRRRGALRSGRDSRAEGQSGLRMRRDPARGQEAGGMQAVRHRLHAGDADGLLHGLARGRLLRALDLRPLPRTAATARRPNEPTAASSISSTAASISRTAPAGGRWRG